MKMSKTLQNDELPNDALDSVEDIKVNLVTALIGEFDNQMRKRGKYLDNFNKSKLHDQLMREADVKVTMSVKVEEYKLDNYGIFLTDKSQAALQSWGVER